jgi:F-type H+-transporting ATPase subunit gamma
MASGKELRRRIKSIKNTSQITKAMQMVSATKMRRAQNQAIAGRPYQTTLLSILSAAASKADPTIHPFLRSNNSSKKAILFLSTDKGLCGSLNTNLFRLIASSSVLNDKDTNFYTIGKKGREFIVRSKRNLEADFENPEKIDFNLVIRLRKFFVSLFLKEEISELYLLYPDFISTLRQEASLKKILPIDQKDLPQIMEESAQAKLSDFLFEPNPGEVLDFALNHFLEMAIYQAFFETKASEHSARMIAMQNASENAKDLVTDLNLTYNGLRQDAITTELLEIVSSGAALE